MSPTALVRRVESARDLERFIAFPYRLHRGDPYWVPPLRMDIRSQLSRDKNPFFGHAEAEYYVAERAGEVVGRIAAIHNRAHNDFHDDRIGFFGFFDCVNEADVAGALFDAAGSWLKGQGLDTMRGPASFSTNDECGLVVDGFDSPPTVLNPHNPRYYVDLVEGAGFRKEMDLWQYQTVSTELPERLERAAHKVAKRLNVTLRSLDMKHFSAEIDQIKPLYNGAWEKNWGFVPMGDEEIDHLAKQLKPIVVPDLVVFAEREGKPIGFAAAIPT